MAFLQMPTTASTDLPGPAEDPLDPLSPAPRSVHDLVLNDRHTAVRPVTPTTM